MSALGGGVIALVVLAVLFELAGLDVAANFVKFAAVTLAGWWFLGFFEERELGAARLAADHPVSTPTRSSRGRRR